MNIEIRIWMKKKNRPACCVIQTKDSIDFMFVSFAATIVWPSIFDLCGAIFGRMHLFSEKKYDPSNQGRAISFERTGANGKYKATVAEMGHR